jgi:hypothetical protein
MTEAAVAAERAIENAAEKVVMINSTTTRIDLK